ncbi:MAG TPA: hypothetical protein QF564_00595 [Pirellulaceae bacterium]|nr:hypothetical protein [Pirellulaceae bacterium]
MDFLNRGWKQVTDLFETMTPAARLTTGLLLAVLVVSFVYIFRQNVDSGGEYLFGAQTLSEPEIAMMEGAFAEAGLENGRREGNRIRVPAGRTSEYMAALVSGNAMPEKSSTPYDKLLKERSHLDSRPVQALRERVANEQSLEQMIRNLRGIERATVRIQERDNGRFPRGKVRTAVATVKADGTKHLDRDQINTIRDIVAASAGTEREHVTVADSNANLSYRGSGKNGMPLADEDPYAARVRLYEDHTKQSIENLLTTYPGAMVEVRAELGKDFVNRVDSYTYEGQPVTVKQSNSSKTGSSNNSDNGGRPGAASNGLGNTPQQVGNVASNDSQSEETFEQTEAVPSATQTTIQKYGFAPERVTASIRIPRSLFRTIWMVENPPADGEEAVEPDKNQLEDIELRETQAIKDMVTTLLPPPPLGDDPYPLVTVLPYTSTPIDDPPEPSMAANAGSWFASNWQTIALFGAAMFSVFFLRGMVQSPNPAPSRAAEKGTREPPLARDGLDDEELEKTDIVNSLKSKFQNSGRSLRDELSELVHEDPDSAASVLANWIGEVA